MSVLLSAAVLLPTITIVVLANPHTHTSHMYEPFHAFFWSFVRFSTTYSSNSSLSAVNARMAGEANKQHRCIRKE